MRDSQEPVRIRITVPRRQLRRLNVLAQELQLPLNTVAAQCCAAGVARMGWHLATIAGVGEADWWTVRLCLAQAVPDLPDIVQVGDDEANATL